MNRPLPRIVWCACLLMLAANSPAHGQAAKPHADEDCGEIERNYDLVKAEAVSLQINIALFAAADRGCDAFASKLS